MIPRKWSTPPFFVRIIVPRSEFLIDALPLSLCFAYITAKNSGQFDGVAIYIGTEVEYTLKAMTSRERVLASLNHRSPDRIPIDFSGHRSSGIAALAYPKLRDYLGFPPAPVRVYDLVQQLAIVDEDILDRFGVDTVEMGRGFLKEEKDWKEWILPDGTPCLIPYYINLEKRGDDWAVLTDRGTELGIQKKGWLYFEQTYFPLMERGIRYDDFSDLEDTLNDTIWTGAVSPGAHLPLDRLRPLR